MKKIVALVLSLVMVLGLATTAFGAITLWDENNKTVVCDVFDASFNTKQADSVTVTFHSAKELKLDKTGAITQVGNIAYYTTDSQDYTGFYVMVPSIPANVSAADYILVKAHDANVTAGQTSADAYYILKSVDFVQYETKATEFTAWSDACEAYAKPANADTVKYYTIANATPVLTDVAVKYPAVDAGVCALVGNEVIALGLDGVAVTQHAWTASKWNDKDVAVEYTCTACKTVGTVINSPVNAPAGAKIDRVGNILIAYTMGKTAGGATVESAQTFDAGIAMYVGMSVMAAAGSAVVLKKKD